MSNTKTTLTDEWGSFTAIPNEFIEQSNILSDHARWMFIVLRFYTNAKTGTAFPSYEELKSRTGWAYNTIAKAVKELESTGWLTRRKQFSGTTHYTLVKKSQSLPLARTGEKDQSLLMASPCQSQGQSLPLASTVLANSKPNKTEINKTEKNKTVCESPVPATANPRTQDPVDIATSILGMIPIYLQETIEAAGITQPRLWRKCCEDWKASRYSLRNIPGLIDKYRRAESQDARDKEIQNGQNRPVRETANGRAARRTLEIIAELTGQDSGDSGLDPKNANLVLPTAFR